MISQCNDINVMISQKYWIWTNTNKHDFSDYYDRKNWIGQALKTPDSQAIGKTAPHYKHPKSPALHRVINNDYRFNG